MALVSAGATGLTSIPGAITEYQTDKAQKKRLEELKRLEEMNALGLTEEQFANYRNRLEQPVMQAQKRADAEMRRLATPTAQPARQLQQAMLAQQNREAIESQIASTLLGIDLQKQAEQRQEMKDLRAAQDERLTQRMDALTAPALAGAEAYIMGQTLQTLYNQPPQQRVETVSQTTGATPDQIQETFPILQKESGPDGLFPQGFEASNRMQMIAEQNPNITSTFGNNTVPVPPILPTSPGYRPQNILSEMGMGITGQTELARRGFDQQDMIRLEQFRRRYPDMSDEELLNYYLSIMGMGGL